MNLPAYELTACPVCGGERARQVASADEVRAEVEDLWAFHTRRLRAGTPPVHLADRVAFSQPPALRIARCLVCGILFRNPREREHELTAIYSDEEAEPSVLESLHESQRRAYRVQARRLARELGRTGSVLEIGSYVGAFLAAAREYRWDARGLDINETATAFARERGFEVDVGTIESAPPDLTLDAVAFWNCFEQLPDPPEAARQARSRLRQGGILAVRVPNGQFYATVRTRLGGPLAPLARALLAHNNLLGFPYRIGFTTRSLARLLSESGFDVRRVYGDTLVPLADRWTRRWAAVEEHAVKAALRGASRSGLLRAAASPWLEVYARAR